MGIKIGLEDSLILDVIDASHWQEPWLPETALIIPRGAFFKMGEGWTWIDESHFDYVDICRERNIPFGLYWFFRSNATPSYALNTILEMIDFHGGIENIPLGIMIDVETLDGVQRETRDRHLREVLDGIVAAIPDILTYDPPRLGIYSRKYFFDPNVSTALYYSRYAQWVAHWTYDPYKRPLLLMQSWVRAGKEEDYHQYGAHGVGSTYGFSSTNLDMNTARKLPQSLPPTPPDLEERVARLEREALKRGWDLSTPTGG